MHGRPAGRHAALGFKARPPGTAPPSNPRGQLYVKDDRKAEHDFNPDFNISAKNDCEIVKAAQARAQAVGLTDWSCPELAPAVGCNAGG